MAAKRALVTVVAIVGLIVGVLAPTSGAQDGGDAPPPPLLGNTIDVSDAGSVAFVVSRFDGRPTGACTGTLVAPMWVLTAAHCVQRQSGSNDVFATSVEIMLGSVDMDDFFFEPPGVEIHVAAGWVIHGDYDPDPSNIANDIALVKLPTASAQPTMPIATDESLVVATGNQRLPATVYGFGQSCQFPDTAATPCPNDDVLRSGPTEIVSDDASEDEGYFLRNKTKRRNFFMLPDVTTQAAVCFGDSGGPVTVMQDGVEMVAGVNSYLADTDGNNATCAGDGPGGTSGVYLNGVADIVSIGLHDFVQEIINAPTLTCFGMTVTLPGTSFPDKIIGTSGTDVMDGRGDDDLLVGLDGDDFQCGSSGDDEIHGGDGDDSAKGGGGDDTINGDAGEDRLRGNGGGDTIRGGSNADNIKGGGGDDTINGGGGGDTIKGNGGDDTITGKKGSDNIKGGGGDDTINGNGGTDTCAGGTGSNTIRRCEL